MSTTNEMSNGQKALGIIILLGMVATAIIGSIDISEAMDREGVTIDSPVSVAKQAFYQSAKTLCEQKTKEYKNNIMTGEGSAADQGQQIDRLKEDKGCYKFASDVLLSTVNTEEAGK